MEEDLNEHDLEDKLYAMLHHVDETQNNLIDSQQNKSDVTQFVENGPRSTVRRYWRTGANNNPFQKVNTSKDPAPGAAQTITIPDNSKPKEEKNPRKSPSPVDLSILQSPVPQYVSKTIEFLEHEDVSPVVLESSDEDEVVEVALPPKPTIMIESSDEDELHIVPTKSPKKAESKSNSEQKSNSGQRDISTSPVPSVVSSVSDEFIRGDCIALNISSRHPDKHSFDFSLHGSDLLVQNTNTPPKKKKKKKNKVAVTSTPISAPTVKSVNVADGCFATPKSKAKTQKEKSKLFTEKTLSNPDVYDSDSNQSTVDTNNKNPYIVTEKSLPSADVYESDSNQSEIVKEINTDQGKNVFEAYSSDSSISNDKHEKTPKSFKKNNTLHDSSVQSVDLTVNDNFVTLDDTGICESIVMANVTGLTEFMNHGDENRILPSKKDISKYVSSKVPSILNEDLDFDNLKGKEKICKRRRYSLTTLRAEMEKFYNESWGGEDFNHREIQKNMSRDKSLWAIDPKDRMPSLAQRKVKCNYCNRVGHRDDTCRQKPPVCYMCGNQGHFEPRCPSKICVNCGAPNFMYSTMCRNCSSWPNMRCAECGQCGHPASHCPDVWRRYHNTINTDVSLEMCTQPKKYNQLFCSGCSRRGHLVHSCRVTVPFSGLPINSPFVCFYRPIFSPTNEHNQHNKLVRSKSFSETYTPAPTPPRPDSNKRHSKSPTVHETHTNKKRNLSVDDNERQNAKSPVATATPKNVPVKEVVENTPKNKNKAKSLDSSATVTTTEKAPDFISISSSNHDNKGQVIQDNEVSDTSDVVTSARIYVTNDIINKIKTKEGEDWLKETMTKLNVVVGTADVNSFLNIKGKLADQEAFQSELREWVQSNTNKGKNPSPDTSNSEDTQNPSAAHNLPKNRNNLLRQLNKALDSLNEDLGDPKALYKELTFSQNKHQKLLKQKVISPTVISNSRTHINNMLKKLNIILLGQAGLADGSEHLNELLAFKQKLMNSRHKTISPSIRKEIGEHYHCIFSPSARDDYSELMKKYYVSNAMAKLAKKEKKRKSVEPKPNIINNNKNDSIPSEEISEKVVTNHCAKKSIGAYSAIEKAKILQRLIFYRQRLKSVRPTCTGSKASKKEIYQIMRQVHALIAMLINRENITSKLAKKVKRIQDQAQKCLAGV